MNKISFILLLIAFNSPKAVYSTDSTAINHSNTFRAEVLAPGIKTLQVGLQNQKHAYPIIELNSDEAIEINFDVLHFAAGWYAYTVTHCNADWTPSKLAPTDYISEFDVFSIEDFANSNNTNVSYTNYKLLLPNEDVQLKKSGNYVVTIFNEKTPNIPAIQVCFSVIDTKIEILAEVINLDDSISAKQQIRIFAEHPEYEINFPQMDIKAFVYQNGRGDNAIKGISPSSLKEKEMIFQDSTIIFEAGNEYRQFAFLNGLQEGVHIKSAQFLHPYHRIKLLLDHTQKNQTYTPTIDMNGYYRIRNTEVEDPDTEASYSYVYFSLDADSLPDANVHIGGAIFNNTLSEQSKMLYNKEQHCYEKTILLKQGVYDYQYLTVPKSKDSVNDLNLKASTLPFEGNFPYAVNQYLVLIYHRPNGLRYDQLIGKKVIVSNAHMR